MLRSLNPTLSDKDIPRRTTVHSRVLSRYKDEHEKLRQELMVCCMHNWPLPFSNNLICSGHWDASR